MTSEDRSHALENILQRLYLVLGQVERCVIVSEEGLPVASYPLDETNGAGQMPERMHENAELAGLAAALAGAGERAMQRLAQGKAGRLVLEGGERHDVVLAGRGGLAGSPGRIRRQSRASFVRRAKSG